MQFTVEDRAVYAATGGRPFDDKLPAVVFVHAAGLDHTVWSLQTRYFAHHGCCVLALDLPGHGRSEGPLLDSIQAMAEWLARFIEVTGVDDVALVGHSMGALAALECAGSLGPRLRVLALLGVAHKMPVHEDLLSAAMADHPQAFDLITSWGYGVAGHLGGNWAPGLWLMGGSARLLERCRSGVLYNDLNACDLYKRALEVAAGIACPCHLILGANDRMTPATRGHKLAEAIPGATVTVIPDAGHMMMLEKPNETLDAIRAVL